MLSSPCCGLQVNTTSTLLIYLQAWNCSVTSHHQQCSCTLCLQDLDRVDMQDADSLANERRNRYFNVVPFDHNRVRLRSGGQTTSTPACSTAAAGSSPPGSTSRRRQEAVRPCFAPASVTFPALRS